MKKWLIQLIILALVFNGVIMPSTEAFASNNNENSIEENAETIDLNVDYDVNEVSKESDKTVYRVDVKEELDISNDNFEMQVEEYSDTELNINSQLVTKEDELYADMHINVETGNMFVEVNENGKETKYDLIFEEIEGENFKALLIDQDTEEVFIMNTIDAHASAIPVLAIVVQQGARWAIKKYGKKHL